MLSLEMTREEKNLRQHFQAKMGMMAKRKRVKKERRKSDES